MARTATKLLLLLLAASPAHALEAVATLPDLAALASEIGGPKLRVKCLSRHSENPHYVDPRPSLLLPLSRADLVLVNGLGLEVGWLPPLLLNARNAKIQEGQPGYFEAGRFAGKVLGGGDADRAKGDVHPEGNPHFNYDPRAMANIAEALGKRLGEIDPGNAAAYTARAAKAAAGLRGFGAGQATRFRSLPAEKRRVVAYHKSMTYLFEWLGLEAIAHVEPLPGVAPSPGHVVKVMKAMKAKGARLIVQESFYPAKTSQQLSKLVSGAMLTVPAATAFDHKETYLHHMKHVTDELYEALSR